MRRFVYAIVNASPFFEDAGATILTSMSVVPFDGDKFIAQVTPYSGPETYPIGRNPGTTTKFRAVGLAGSCAWSVSY